MIGTRFPLLLAVLSSSPPRRHQQDIYSQYFQYIWQLGRWILSMWEGFSKRISPLLLCLRERRKHKREREERGKALLSKKGNGKPTGRLRSAPPQWCTHAFITPLFPKFFLYYVCFGFKFFHSSIWLFQRSDTTAHRMEGGKREVWRREADREKEIGGVERGGMQRWKRVVVISSFGREQIIKHFLKPISALMYVCVCVCATVTTTSLSLKHTNMFKHRVRCLTPQLYWLTVERLLTYYFTKIPFLSADSTKWECEYWCMLINHLCALSPHCHCPHMSFFWPRESAALKI